MKIPFLNNISKYVGYLIIALLFVVHMIWGDNEYYITGLLTLYLIGLLYSTYNKIQYVEGARPHLIYFSTANDRLNDLPSILGSLFYVGLSALLLFMDNDFLGPYGIYYLIGYTIISIWSSFYGKIPSARFSIDKEDNILEYDDDGDHNDEISTTDIQDVTISLESITLGTEQKKINLIHLSLDEKEIKLISNYFQNQLHITPTLLTKEEEIALQ
ncbi:hypothetical protein [Dokdonia sp.]|uniref:hypothetical protein n=1 Tax=Dokdonia sp. TaxID=2024995 RepID=UPI003265B258